MPHHFFQTRVLPQTLEIVHALAPGGVEDDEALHQSRFVITPLALLHAHLLAHTLGQAQGAEGLHDEGNSPQCRQRFLQRLRVNLEQQG